MTYRELRDIVSKASYGTLVERAFKIALNLPLTVCESVMRSRKAYRGVYEAFRNTDSPMNRL